MKNYLALLLLMVLISPVYAASTFTVTGENSITVSTTTSRQISFVIRSDINDTFKIKLSEPKPWMTLETSQISLSNDETGIVAVYFSPYQTTTVGIYRTDVIFESIRGEKETKTVYISVTKGETVEVEKILVKGDLFPTGSLDLEISVKNFRTVSANDLVLKTSVVSTDKVIDFTNEIARIDPDQSSTVTNSFDLEKLSPPGKYTIETILYEAGAKISEAKQDFRVVEKPVIVEERVENSFFLGYTRTITIRNEGNKNALTYETSDVVTGLSSIFFYGDDPVRVDGNNYYWKFVNIEPGQEIKVTYSVNYQPLLLIIIVIILFAWYMMFRVRTVQIKKFIMQKKIIKEGSEFTVGIEINNTSGSKVQDIMIHDFVPSVFAVKDTEGPVPTKKKTAVGTELVWNFKEMLKKEERILTYKLVPTMGVPGHIRLPPARIEFKKGKRKMINRSWFTVLGDFPVKSK